MPVVYNTEPTALPSLSVLDAVNLIRDQGNERVAGVLGLGLAAAGLLLVGMAAAEDPLGRPR